MPTIVPLSTPAPHPVRRSWSDETDVYRLYAGDLEVRLDLLYVGISFDARVRFEQHRRREFWKLVTYATVTRYATRSAAEVVEAHAIATEYPMLNISHGNRSARTGDPKSAYRSEFVGYMETPIGLTDREWAE